MPAYTFPLCLVLVAAGVASMILFLVTIDE